MIMLKMFDSTYVESVLNKNIFTLLKAFGIFKRKKLAFFILVNKKTLMCAKAYGFFLSNLSHLLKASTVNVQQPLILPH